MNIDLRETEYDILYLADLFSKFNYLNLYLQVQDLTLINAISDISIFKVKLNLCKHNRKIQIVSFFKLDRTTKERKTF